MKKLTISIAIVLFSLVGYTQQVSIISNEEFQAKVWNYTDTTNTEFNFIGDKPTIVHFWGSWAAPCKRTDTLLLEMQNEYKDKINIYTLGRQNGDVFKAFKVKRVPTILFISKDGKYESVLGDMTKEEMTKMIEDKLFTKSED